MRCRCLLCLMIMLVIGCSESPTDNQDNQQPDRPSLVRVPSEAATIQEGIDLIENNDTVLVADGLYTGSGNRDIDLGGKSVVLLSENGPLKTVIDCGGSESAPHFAFTGFGGEAGNVIDGFTISGAYGAQGPVLNLKFTSPVIRNCILVDNVATVSGGAIRCKNASPTFLNCTFINNTAPIGGAVYLLTGSEPNFTNCIIAFSSGGGAIESFTSSFPTLVCSDLFGNVGGDWTGVIAAQLGSNGNISLDPLFCELSDHRLNSDSPCLPTNNSCGIVIGAAEATCD